MGGSGNSQVAANDQPVRWRGHGDALLERTNTDTGSHEFVGIELTEALEPLVRGDLRSAGQVLWELRRVLWAPGKGHPCRRWTSALPREPW